MDLIWTIWVEIVEFVVGFVVGYGCAIWKNKVRSRSSWRL